MCSAPLNRAFLFCLFSFFCFCPSTEGINFSLTYQQLGSQYHQNLTHCSTQNHFLSLPGLAAAASSFVGQSEHVVTKWTYHQCWCMKVQSLQGTVSCHFCYVMRTVALAQGEEGGGGFSKYSRYPPPFPCLGKGPFT